MRQGDFLVQEAAAFEPCWSRARKRIAAAQASLTAAVTQHHAASISSHARSETDPGWSLIAQARATLLVFRVVPASSGPHAAAPVSHRDDDRAVPREQDHTGFSVLEILVVASIVVILAAMAAPRYEAALDAARIAKAIGDIKAIEKDVQVHFVLNGCYPGSLTDLGRDTLRDPWGNAYVYNVLTPKHGTCQACDAACVPLGKARKDHKLVPINSDFDLFSMGKDGQLTGPLTASASHDDIVRGSDGVFVGLAADY